jgi:hypothetical protein
MTLDPERKGHAAYMEQEAARYRRLFAKLPEDQREEAVREQVDRLERDYQRSRSPRQKESSIFTEHPWLSFVILVIIVAVALNISGGHSPDDQTQIGWWGDW